MMAILGREVRGQFLSVWRTPAFALPTLLFPAMFYVFFALLFGMSRSHDMPTYLLATYGVFGVMGPALFGFGIGIAVEKGEGWLRLKRVAPVPAVVPLAARAVMAMLFALIVFAILATLGAAFGDVRMPTRDWSVLAVTLVAGAIPFCAMGLAAGLWLTPQAAPAVVNLIYLPLAFLSGLWVPLLAFPGWLQSLAVAMPPYHLAAIALDVVGSQPSGNVPMHAGVLVAFTVAFLAVAAVGWRRIREN